MKTKREINIQYIKQLLQEISPDTELISQDYRNARQKLIFKCKCGKIFTKNFYTIDTQQKCLCNSCSKKDGWAIIRKPNTFVDDIIQGFKNCSLTVLETDNITLARNKVLVSDSVGYKGAISLRNAQLGKHFSIFSLIFNEENLLYNLNHFSKIHNYGNEVIRYWKDDRKIKIECKCCCGSLYITDVGNFTSQNQVYCRQCTKTQSKNERLVKIELQKLNIEFCEQKRFQDCRSPITNYLLPFDFYLIDKNIIIEVDGQQHFYPARINQISQEKANKAFERLKYNDMVKTNYCINNHINLCRISYQDIKNKNYKEIIQSVIK